MLAGLSLPVSSTAPLTRNAVVTTATADTSVPRRSSSSTASTVSSYSLATPPRSALFLGLAGVLPFAWGAATTVSPALADAGAALVGTQLVGAPVLVAYGCTILSFMSGVLWGFATRIKSPTLSAVGYAVSTVPALYVLFAVQTGAFGVTGTALAIDTALGRLAAGYAGLLALDYAFASQALAPAWWMPMRGLLTTLVVTCLGLGAFACHSS